MRVADMKGKQILGAVFIDHSDVKDTGIFVSEISIGDKSYYSRVEAPESHGREQKRYVMDLYNFYQQGLFIEV